MKKHTARQAIVVPAPIVRAPALLLFLAGASASFGQTTYHVAPCGDDSWTGTSAVCAAPDGPKRTIQAAIDASVNGDTVLVADGTYTGPGNRDMDFGGRAIGVRSTGGWLMCTIDCDASPLDQHRAFRFHTAETSGSVVQGFTIRGGAADLGGAILCEAGASPSILECAFEENAAYPTLAGGGAGGAIRSEGGSPTITGCSFLRNTAVRAASVGGLGGAIQFLLGGAPVLTDCTFEENVAYGSGGAVESRSGPSPTLIRCSFIRNETLDLSFNGGGAYLAVFEGTSTLRNCSFTENQSARQGGAIWILRGAHADLTACSFFGNAARDGSAVAFTADAQGALTNCQFAGNVSIAPTPSALSVSQGSFGPSSATIYNCTFASNVAISGDSAIGVFDQSTLSGYNCIFWGNFPNSAFFQFNDTLTLSYSSFGSPWNGPGEGNITADPGFVRDPFDGGDGWPDDADTPGDERADNDYGNLRLARSSPCIDAGDNAVLAPDILTDLAGDPRFHNDPWTPDTGLPDPARIDLPIVDMGAFEFQQSSCPADFNADAQLNSQDFFDFLAAFFAGEADFNADGMTNSQDFFDFLTAFFNGC
jgi:hypothetical protein